VKCRALKIRTNKFGKKIRDIYKNCEYIIHEVPFADINNRIESIINKIKNEKICE